MGYEEDTTINRLDLGSECEKQSSLVYSYGVISAEKYKAWLDAKDFYNVEKADKELKLRSGALAVMNVTKDAKDSKPLKITGDLVKAYLDNEPDLVELQKKINQAKYEYDIADIGVNSLEHKKRMLTLMVELMKMGITAEPQESLNQNNALNKKFGGE